MVNTLIKIKAAMMTIAGYSEEQSNVQLPHELSGIVSEGSGQMIFRIEEQLFSYTLETDRKVLLYDVQFHLTELVDLLFELSGKEQISGRIFDVFQTVAEKSVAVLNHLFARYIAYFNLSGKLPAGYFRNAHASNYERVHKIITLLYAEKIDVDLVQVLNTYLMNDGPQDLYLLHTWQQWQYLQEMINWLDLYTQQQTGERVGSNLLLILIARNFNSIHIYAYFLKLISRITLADQPLENQQQDLLYLLKEVRQVIVDPKYIYDVNVQPLKQSLIECLTAELEYVEQREKVVVKHFRNSADTPSRFYFDVAVTLAEFMFLIKVWLEISFIHTKFKSYVYEFISNHIHTKRAENLSKKSMRNHLSSTYLPDRLVLNVRDWLSKMINHIDLHYKS
jgi:hypothetical protein